MQNSQDTLRDSNGQTTNRRPMIRALLFSSAAAVFLSDTALAQSGPMLEEITVTAQRREQNLQDTSVSVTAFSSLSLRQKEVTNLIGLARFTPNVEMNNGRADGGGSSLNAYIRGVGQQDFIFPTDPGVGLYVDDVYMARTIAGALDLSDVERIEILRGPQGTLYGKNTIGGAIKIISKPAVLDGDWTGTLEGATGRYGRADFKGYVSGPLIDGKLGIKLSAASLHRDGYGERAFDDVDLGDEGKQMGSVALRWQANEDVEVTLRGSYSRQRQNGPVGSMVNRMPSDVDLTDLAGLLIGGIPGSPFAGATDPTPENPFLFDDLYNALIVPTLNAREGLPAGTLYDNRWVSTDPFVSNGTAPSFDNNDIWTFSADVAWNINENLSLKSITAYRDMEAEFPRDGDHSPYPVSYTHNKVSQEQFSQEFQLSGTLMDDRLNFVTGVYYMNEKAFDNNRVELFSGLYEVLSPIAPFLYGPSGDGTNGDYTTPAFSYDYFPLNKIDINTYAVFGQVTFDVSEQFSVTLGGRYSEDRKTYTQDHILQLVADPQFADGGSYDGDVDPLRDVGLARYVGPRELKDNWGSFTPKVGLDYRVTEDNLLYATWSKGFKSGGWSPRPTQQNATDLSYDPEKLSTFEIGSKNTLLDGRMTFNVAAFYSDYKDVQVTTIGSSSTGALLLLTRNIGDAELYGLEAEVAARPIEGLDLSAAMGYLHNKWDKFNRASCTPGIFDATGGQFCDTDLSLDDKLVDAPEWTLNLGAEYTVPLGEIGSLSLRGDASFRSKTWKDPYNLGGGTDYLGNADPRATGPAVGEDDMYAITVRELSQPSYWLVNLRAAYRTSDEDWEIALAVTNVTNEKYIMSITPVRNFGYDEAYFGRPREWSLSVRHSF